MKKSTRKNTKSRADALRSVAADDGLTEYFGIVDQPGTDSKSVSDAIGRMNNALLTKCTEILDLVVAADQHDVQARYEIAVHCQEVCNGDGKGGKYGDRAMAKLARALGWSKSTVYDYTNVAKSWPDRKKFDELAGKTDKFDKPLSWYHIVLLATVATAECRGKLAENALKHGWNVRELRNNLQLDAAGPAEEDSAAAPQPKLPRVLDTTVQNYVTQVGALKSNAAAFGAHLVEEIKDADPADLTDVFVDRLTQARQDISELLKQLDECLEQVRQRRALAVRTQDSQKGPVADPLQDRFGDEHHEQPEETLVGAM